MKNFTLLIITILLSLTFLNSHNNVYTYEGTIEGWDTRRCGCCGGWIIKTEGQTYLADSLPPGTRIFASQKNEYPVKIYFNFIKKPGRCGNKIIITFIIRRR